MSCPRLIVSVTLSRGLHEVGGLNSGQYTLLGHPLGEQGPGPTLSKGTSSCFEEITVKLFKCFVYTWLYFPKFRTLNVFNGHSSSKLGWVILEGKESPVLGVV